MAPYNINFESVQLVFSNGTAEPARNGYLVTLLMTIATNRM